MNRIIQRLLLILLREIHALPPACAHHHAGGAGAPCRRLTPARPSATPPATTRRRRASRRAWLLRSALLAGVSTSCGLRRAWRSPHAAVLGRAPLRLRVDRRSSRLRRKAARSPLGMTSRTRGILITTARSEPCMYILKVNLAINMSGVVLRTSM